MKLVQVLNSKIWNGRFLRKSRRSPIRAWAYRACMLLGLTWIILLAINSADDKGYLSSLIYILCGVAGAVGLAIDMKSWSVRLQKRVGSSWFGRAVIAGIVAMSGSFSAAYASTLINSFSGVAQNPFPYTTAWLAVPATLALSLIVITIVYISVSFVMLGYVLRDLPADIFLCSPSRARVRRYRRSFYVVARMLALGIILSGLLAVAPWFEKILIFTAKQFAVRFEMYPIDPCAFQEERISRLSSDVVLVASLKNGDLQFERRKCTLDMGL